MENPKKEIRKIEDQLSLRELVGKYATDLFNEYLERTGRPLSKKQKDFIISRLLVAAKDGDITESFVIQLPE